MGIKTRNKRAIVNDCWGVTAGFLLLGWLTGGLAGIAITYAIEDTYGALITPETSPTFAGLGLDYLWVIVALVVAIGFFILVAFGRAPPRTSKK